MATPDTAGEDVGLQDFRFEPNADGGFTVRGRRVDPPGLVELEGQIENGAIVFKTLSVRSDSITVDTPRLNIGAIRAAVASQIRHDPHQTEKLRELVRDWHDLPLGERDEMLRATRFKARYVNEARAQIYSTGRLPAGRPRLSDSFLRGVALDYIAAFLEDPRRVALNLTEVYREKLSDPNLSVNTVKAWIRRCRLDDWLAPASKGKPVADVGPRLEEWFNEARSR